MPKFTKNPPEELKEIPKGSSDEAAANAFIVNLESMQKYCKGFVENDYPGIKPEVENPLTYTLEEGNGESSHQRKGEFMKAATNLLCDFTNGDKRALYNHKKTDALADLNKKDFFGRFPDANHVSDRVEQLTDQYLNLSENANKIFRQSIKSGLPQKLKIESAL